jgi:hypothetical protein
MDAKWIEADASGPPVTTLGPYETADTDTRMLRMRYAHALRHTRAPAQVPRQLYDELVITI